MNSYFVFAIILTLSYLIYYAVVIVRELYKKKGSEMTNEEVFDIGTEELAEESIRVTEEETGFSVGGEQYETGMPAAASGSIGPDGNSGETPQERFERLKANAEAKLEDTEPYLSDPLTAEEMYKAMLSGGRPGNNRPEMVWRPVKDRL
ncbi:hypothetical protein [Alistipes putredinis]|uniref:hypothetical protein n=1 Tax=Alistipes putredinis TaxID=28117 RepID=UPI003AB187E5